ncbi:MAG: copper amine oxidase N-terminal domain-containing protein [Firmicutes bacterium]|nr:copper amine oxidase N-terminal domain-containing protein [Bacillota bacterium]
MWRKISSIFVALAVLFVFAAAAQASSEVIVNGKTLTFDTQPVVEKGRVLVPLRAIFEALDAKVNWDAATQTVTAQKDDVNIKLVVGGQAYKNNQAVTLDVPAKLVNGRTLVPLRFVSEALGAKVSWDKGVVTITAAAAPETSNSGNATGANGQTAYQLYSKASQAIKDAQSFASDINQTAVIDKDGQKVTADVTGVDKIILNQNGIQIFLTRNTQIMGKNIAAKEYYKDGYLYVDAQDKKMKLAISNEDVIKQSDQVMLNLPENMIKDQSVNGNTISLTIDKAAVKDSSGQIIDQIVTSLGKSAKVDINFTDISITATLDNNQLSTVNTKYSAEITANGKTITVNIDTTMKITQVGNVTIEFPADLDSYTNASALSGQGSAGGSDSALGGSGSNSGSGSAAKK